MKSTALLLEDHKQILRALDILGEMATRARHGQSPNRQDLTDLWDFLEGFGDRIHQGREEQHLFPALLTDPEQKNHTRLLSARFEHDRQRSLIQGLEESIFTENAKDFVFCATRLAEILREHIDDEEATLFPLADATLSQGDDERITAAMKELDQSGGEADLPDLLRRLDELESKYLGKAHAKARELREESRREP